MDSHKMDNAIRPGQISHSRLSVQSFKPILSILLAQRLSKTRIMV